MNNRNRYNCIFSKCNHPKPDPNHRSEMHNPESKVWYKEEDGDFHLRITFQRYLQQDTYSFDDPAYGHFYCICGHHSLLRRDFDEHVNAPTEVPPLTDCTIPDAFYNVKNRLSLEEDRFCRIIVKMRPKQPEVLSSSSAKRPNDGSEEEESNRKARRHAEKRLEEFDVGLIYEQAEKWEERFQEFEDEVFEKLDEMHKVQSTVLTKLAEMQKLIKGSDEKIDDMDNGVHNVEAATGKVRKAVRKISTTVETISTDVQAIQAMSDKANNSSASLHSEILSVKDRVHELEGVATRTIEAAITSAGNLKTSVSSVATSVEKLETHVANLTGTIGDVDASMRSVQATVQALCDL